MEVLIFFPINFSSNSKRLKIKKNSNSICFITFDEHSYTLRISCQMRTLSTEITGVSRAARESIPGVTDEGDGRRGTTGGARGVAVRDRWLSNTRHFGVTPKIGTRDVCSRIRREITFNVCYVQLGNLDKC